MKRIILYAVMAMMICCNHACCEEGIPEEFQEELPNDINYPTTISRLPEETLLQMRKDFAQRNPYVCSSLNQFGFCASDAVEAMDAPSGYFTKEEAIEAIKEFVARNPEHTGISNPDDLQLEQMRSTTHNNIPVNWHCFAGQKEINNLEINNICIVFHTRNRALYSCDGNYFPNVYIPEKFNFDLERAKSRLLGKEIFHVGWGGEYSLGIIKAKHLKDCPANLIVVPLITDEKIELRIAWQIKTLAIFAVDVMTGKIIREESCVIS